MNSAQARVAAVVLTWNSVDVLGTCLRSLSDQTVALDVFVVDNASADDTVRFVRDEFPHVRVIESDDNLGYAGGINVGLRHVVALHYDSVFLLNPDAYAADGLVAELAELLDAAPELGAVSPEIFHAATGAMWFAGSSIDWSNGLTSHHETSDALSAGPYRDTERISGCAVLVRTAALEQVGLLDEQYFLYYEETDWSVRFVRSGFKLGVAPTSGAWHDASSSTGGFYGRVYQYYMTRNRYYFLRKFGRPRLATAAATALLSLRELKYAVHDGGFSGTIAVARWKAMAVADLMLNRMGRRDWA